MAPFNDGVGFEPIAFRNFSDVIRGEPSVLDATEQPAFYRLEIVGCGS